MNYIKEDLTNLTLEQQLPIYKRARKRLIADMLVHGLGGGISTSIALASIPDLFNPSTVLQGSLITFMSACLATASFYQMAKSSREEDKLESDIKWLKTKIQIEKDLEQIPIKKIESEKNDTHL